MERSPCLPQRDPAPEARQKRLRERRRGYVYLTSERENQLLPVPAAARWPEDEDYSWGWKLGIAPGYLGAYADRLLRRGPLYALQRALFRFDRMQAYRQLFRGEPPAFTRAADRDDAFAWWRVAGPNAISLQREPSLSALRRRIPFDVARVEARLRATRGRRIRLGEAAEAGRLFAVDFRLVQNALRNDRLRDTRWREKYLPAPIGVFLEDEEPGGERTSLLPLAIQVDQPLPEGEPNPVYTPDDGWGWRLAKLYFEVADVAYHVSCGHVGRTHLQLQPFCMATPRQLSEDHPVFVLLRPHTRFTLPANQAAYEYFIHRKHTYHDFYAGRLEDTRGIVVQAYLEKSFLELELETELEARGVDQRPKVYPYREDARRWLAPLREFVRDYVDAFYLGEEDVRGDHELQDWAKELMDPQRGAVQELVPERRLDGKAKLVDLLAQVLFLAGPGHAAQHYSSNHFYRYPPAFPSAAYAPPPWREERIHEARYQGTLPPIRTASRQITYNTFTDYKYDRFGHYEGYRLGRVREAREPIARLRAALAGVEERIAARDAGRPFSYPFLRPSLVPNSANI